MIYKVVGEDGVGMERTSEEGMIEGRHIVCGDAIGEMIAPVMMSPFSRPLRIIFDS